MRILCCSARISLSAANVRTTSQRVYDVSQQLSQLRHLRLAQPPSQLPHLCHRPRHTVPRNDVTLLEPERDVTPRHHTSHSDVSVRVEGVQGTSRGVDELDDSSTGVALCGAVHH